MKKVVDLAEISHLARGMRDAGKRLVATNGCFDLLHVGHVRYLQAARAMGDALVVGLNGDRSVRELKGPGRPINNERDRAEILAALEAVDFVTIFPDLRATRFLEAAAPQIYVKGGDYAADTLDPEERAALQGLGAEIRFIPFAAGYSTSAMVQHLKTGQ